MFIPAHRMPVVVAGLSALFFLSALPALARAQESTSPVSLYPIESISNDGAMAGDFVVGPGKVDVTVRPGQSKIVEMVVTNRTGERRRFNLTIEDAEGSEEVDTPIVLLGSNKGPYSVREYITVPHSSFELGHNERARIPVTITLPPNAVPGGLYGSVLVNTVALEAGARDTSGTVPQSAIIARVGTVFFVTVPGVVERDGNLKEFGTTPPTKFFQEGPISFGLLYENRGSIHLAPYGEMRIKNMFGEEVGYMELDPWFVLPESIRLREVTWEKGYLFGRYTATAYINRSYDDTIDEMSYTFWVLPWKPIALTFLGLFGILFILRFFFKSFQFKRNT